MDSTEGLINFLEKKALEIIYFFKGSNSILKNLNYNESNLKMLKGKVAQEAKILADRQAYLNKILELLKKISVIKKKSCEISIIDSHIEEIFNSYVNNILSEKDVYDKNHPLFDYQPFKKKLLKGYIKAEDYEMCIKLGAIDNN